MSFTKADLKTGDVVVNRIGEYYMYFDEYAGEHNVFVGIFEEFFFKSDDFLCNMKHKNGVEGYDIVKVIRPFGPYSFPKRDELQILGNHEVVFEESKKKISMSEAVKRLSKIEGCEVEIV